MNSKYRLISGCRDNKFLFDKLSEDSLNRIEEILKAYSEDRFEVIPSRYENGEPNYYGTFELKVNDDSYHVDGREIPLIRWYESWGEEVDYIVDLFERQ